MGQVYERSGPLQYPVVPRIYPTAGVLCYSKRSAWLPARTKMIRSASPLPLSRYLDALPFVDHPLKASNSSAECKGSRPLFSATLTSSARSGGTSSHGTW